MWQRYASAEMAVASDSDVAVKQVGEGRRERRRGQ